MNNRRFAVVALAVTLAMWLDSTVLVIAQESSSANATPSNAAVPVTEPVQLPSEVADILKLSRAKVNDDVTVAFIQNGEHRYPLTASEVVYLRKEGLSDRVLTAMLNQQPEFATAPQTPPAPGPTASAPQYAEPPTTTTFAETVPASTVYVPSTPTYYSFYDPWPYYYDPWPYWYTSAYWWGYPFFTFGFCWGSCGHWNHGYCHNAYWNNGHWNNDWHNGDHHSSSHDGNHFASHENSPQHDGRFGPGKTGMLGSKGSSSGGVNQAGPRSGMGSPARSAQSAAQAGSSSDKRSQPIASRSSASQVNTASSRSGQGAGPTSTWSNGAKNQTAARDSIENKGGSQFTHNSQPVAARSSASPASGRGAEPTKIRTASAGQGPTSRGAVSQNAPTFAAPSRASASPTVVANRSAGQPVTRPAAPAASYQRSSFSPSYSSRSSGFSPSYSSRNSGSVASIGRPSMSSSYGSMGSSSAFRGGGFSGGNAPRMSSGGGGFHGGGGGGFSHGGGGGGGHR